MFALIWDFATSLGRGLTITGITLVMALICLSAVLVTLALGAPLNRLKTNARRRPGYPNTRALLRK